MPWFKVDDSFGTHPKRMAATPAAIGLWVVAGSWCAQQLTDGHVPRRVLAALGGTVTHARTLVEAGLWEPNGDGWVFHDWVDYQPSRAETLAARQAKAEAGRAGGLASGRSRRQARASPNPKHTRSTTEADASTFVEPPTRPEGSWSGLPTTDPSLTHRPLRPTAKARDHPSEADARGDRP